MSRSASRSISSIAPPRTEKSAAICNGVATTLPPERHADFCVYRVTLDEPIEVDPDAAEDNLGELFVRSPSGAVLEAVGEIER